MAFFGGGVFVLGLGSFFEMGGNLSMELRWVWNSRTSCLSPQSAEPQVWDTS